MGIVERLRLVAAWHTPGGPTPKEPRGRIDNVCLAAIAEIERQANLIERLKVITSELADDLESEAQQRWGYDIRLKRQLARDMDVVLRARALIKEIDGE